MPQVVFDAFQPAFQRPLVGGIADRRLDQATRALLQHRDFHRDMEPVQDVLRLGIEVLRERAHRLASIGEEGNLLVGLHALGLQQIKEPALGLGVNTLHQSETLARRRHIVGIVAAEGQDALASNHLKQSRHLLSPGPSPRAHNATIGPGVTEATTGRNLAALLRNR